MVTLLHDVRRHVWDPVAHGGSEKEDRDTQDNSLGRLFKDILVMQQVKPQPWCARVNEFQKSSLKQIFYAFFLFRGEGSSSTIGE